MNIDLLRPAPGATCTTLNGYAHRIGQLGDFFARGARVVTM
jgi:hypothetical protein